MLGLTQNQDFLNYNSEILSIVLLSGCLYGTALLLALKNPSILKVALIGLGLGLIPFAKLQAVPIALVIGGVVSYHILIRLKLSLLLKLKTIFTLIVSFCLFTIFFVGWLFFVITIIDMFWFDLQ